MRNFGDNHSGGGCRTEKKRQKNTHRLRKQFQTFNIFRKQQIATFGEQIENSFEWFECVFSSRALSFFLSLTLFLCAVACYFTPHTPLVREIYSAEICFCGKCAKICTLILFNSLSESLSFLIFSFSVSLVVIHSSGMRLKYELNECHYKRWDHKAILIPFSYPLKRKTNAFYWKSPAKMTSQFRLNLHRNCYRLRETENEREENTLIQMCIWFSWRASSTHFELRGNVSLQYKTCSFTCVHFRG